MTLSQPLSRHDFFKLAAVVVGLGVAFSAAEALVRLFPGLFPEEIQQALRADPRNYGVAHPYIGHLHTPNATIVVSGRDFKAFHHTDALGFRNDWPWPARAETVVVGDSVAFGYGVADAEAWPAILGRALPRTRLVNLSLIGGGPQQYLRVYETFGAQLQPKLVLVGVWTLNDFANARTFEDWLRSGVGGNYMVFREFGGARAVALQRRHLSARIEGFFDWEVYPLFRKSHLVNLARVVGESMSRTGLTPAKTVEFSDGSRLELIPEDLARASALGQPDRREFHLLVDALQRLHSAARASGAHALMILQPAKEEIYLPLLGDSATEPTRALRAEFDRRGIEYLDSGAGVQATGGGRRAAVLRERQSSECGWLRLDCAPCALAHP